MNRSVWGLAIVLVLAGMSEPLRAEERQGGDAYPSVRPVGGRLTMGVVIPDDAEAGLVIGAALDLGTIWQPWIHLRSGLSRWSTDIDEAALGAPGSMRDVKWHADIGAEFFETGGVQGYFDVGLGMHFLSADVPSNPALQDALGGTNIGIELAFGMTSVRQRFRVLGEVRREMVDDASNWSLVFGVGTHWGKPTEPRESSRDAGGRDDARRGFDSGATGTQSRDGRRSSGDAYSRDGRDYSREGDTYTRDGRDYPREGDTYTRDGRDYPREGDSYTRDGRDYPREGDTYTRDGRDYPREGDTYTRDGRDYPREGDTYTRDGRDYPREGSRYPEGSNPAEAWPPPRRGTTADPRAESNYPPLPESGRSSATDPKLARENRELRAQLEALQAEFRRYREDATLEELRKLRAEQAELKEALNRRGSDPSASQVSETQSGVLLSLRSSVLFRASSLQLEAGAREELRRVAEALRPYPDAVVIVEGHTDRSGDESTNLQLSQERAKLVRAELIHLGLRPSRVEAVGYGSERPAADNSTELGRMQNRRVDIRVLN